MVENENFEVESHATMEFEFSDDVVRRASLVAAGYEPAPQTDARPALILVGPGKHFGEELISRFLLENYRVGVISAREATLDTLRAAFTDKVELLCADITDSGAFGEALERLALRLGGVNCLIYNPKQSIAANGLETEPDDLDRTMKVNVTGALVAIQTLLPHMSRAANASVILTGGGYKDKPDAEKFALAVGKAGLHGMAKALSYPLRRHGVALKTVVIDGWVRRGCVTGRSSEQLANFYWEVSTRPTGRIYKFPRRDEIAESAQLTLPV